METARTYWWKSPAQIAATQSLLRRIAQTDGVADPAPFSIEDTRVTSRKLTVREFPAAFSELGITVVLEGTDDAAPVPEDLRAAWRDAAGNPVTPHPDGDPAAAWLDISPETGGFNIMLRDLEFPAPGEYRVQIAIRAGAAGTYRPVGGPLTLTLEPEDLGNLLSGCFIDYVMRYPFTTKEAVLAAFRRVAAEISDMPLRGDQ